MVKSGESVLFLSCENKERPKRLRFRMLLLLQEECNSCHNPHGSNMKNIIKDRVDRVCYTCHSDAEGKFLKTYTHQTRYGWEL